MNEAVPLSVLQPNSKFSAYDLAKAILFQGKKPVKWATRKAWNGVRRFWRYLNEQNTLAIEHHRMVQNTRDEIYAKNYWVIR